MLARIPLTIDNRLWVQRVPPAPPRPKKKTSLKAKRAERALRRAKPKAKRSYPKKPQKPKSPPPPPKVEEPVSGTRRRTQVAFYGNVTPTAQALKRGNSTPIPVSSRGTRSSARVKGSASALPSSTPSKLKDTPPRPLGTRVSRRLRDADEDEWQHVPDQWLATPNKANGTSKKEDSDDESELSELTDEDEHEAELRAAQLNTEGEAEDQLTPLPDEEQVKAEDEPEEDGEEEESEEEEEEEDEVKLAVKKAQEIPEGFIEWEAVCVTLYDWRTFPEQFANSRDPDEKALYQVLTKHVGPPIIEVLVVSWRAEPVRIMY